jgi:uncharacterized protein (DUF849 family)
LRSRYDAFTLTAAITGGDVLPSQTKFLPVGVEAIVDEAIRAATAGATCVHLHAREDDGKPTGSPEIYQRIVDGIRAKSDVVISITTGGAPGMTADERLAGVRKCRPEIGTFNLGTMNYELFPNPSRWPKAVAEWERAVLEMSGKGVFTNTLDSMRRFAGVFYELGVVPELEAYDLGHIAMARFLIDEGTLRAPVRLQLVLGILGAAGNDLEDLIVLKGAADRILGADLAALSVAAAGYPAEFRHAALAIAWGLDCRVGLEDNLRVARTAQATSNSELVSKACELARLLDRPIQRPEELRAQLQRENPAAG